MKPEGMVYLWLLLVVSSNGGTAPPEAVNQTQAMRTVFRRETPLFPPSYLRLPVFMDSRLPLVEKEQFSPSRGTGQEPLPEPVQDVLFPVRADSGGRPPGAASGVSVRTSCKSNQMLVQVERSILGSGDAETHLKLGTCRSSNSTGDYVYFKYDLDQCGTKRSLVNNQWAYSNELRYDPPKLRGAIRRAAPFSLRVACYYNRYQYAYKIGYAPKMRLRKIYTPMRNRAKFILTPRNARWERKSPSDQFVLGRPMYFEAAAPSLPQDKRLYVHSCYATPEKSHTSTPKFPVVQNFGCMVESKDGRSKFIPYKSNAVRFSVDAFMFPGMRGHLYMHCSMSVGGSVPSPTAKSCNYDTKTRRWVELYGPDSVCTCCNSNCSSAAYTVTKVISSQPWVVEPRVKPATASKRKKFSTTTIKTTEATTTTTTRRQQTTRSVTEPSSLPATSRGKTQRTEPALQWPFGGDGVSWVVEEEEEEQPVNGFAVVEAEEEEEVEVVVPKTRTIFEEVFGLGK